MLSTFLTILSYFDKTMMKTLHKTWFRPADIYMWISCFPSCCSTPTLQSICIYSLANAEAGQAVVNIMAVGVDTIDLVLAAQPSRWTISCVHVILMCECLNAFPHFCSVLFSAYFAPQFCAISTNHKSPSAHSGCDCWYLCSLYFLRFLALLVIFVEN